MAIRNPSYFLTPKSYPSQGKEQKQLAQEADRRASQLLFESR